MSAGVRLYAGTQHGLFVWRSRNGQWDPVYTPSAGLTDGPGDVWQTRDRVDTWEPVALEVLAVLAVWVAAD